MTDVERALRRSFTGLSLLAMALGVPWMAAILAQTTGQEAHTRWFTLVPGAPLLALWAFQARPEWQPRRGAVRLQQALGLAYLLVLFGCLASVLGGHAHLTVGSLSPLLKRVGALAGAVAAVWEVTQLQRDRVAEVVAGTRSAGTLWARERIRLAMVVFDEEETAATTRERVARELVTAVPTEPYFRLMLANALVDQHRHWDALDVLNQAQPLSPRDSALATMRAAALLHVGNAAEALTVADRAVEWATTEEQRAFALQVQAAARLASTGAAG